MFRWIFQTSVQLMALYEIDLLYQKEPENPLLNHSKFYLRLDY